MDYVLLLQRYLMERRCREVLASLSRDPSEPNSGPVQACRTTDWNCV